MMIRVSLSTFLFLYCLAVNAAVFNVTTVAELNAAIGNAAATGDTINIASGTYDIPAFSQIDVNKDISFAGELPRPVFTNSSHSFPSAIFMGGIGTVPRNISYKNLELLNISGSTASSAGIRHDFGNLTVENCKFTNVRMGILSDQGFAMLPGWDSSLITIINNEFVANGYQGQEHPIYVHGGTIIIDNNTITDTIGGHHVKAMGEVSTTITNNILTDGLNVNNSPINSTGGGILTIEGNTINREATVNSGNVINFGMWRTSSPTAVSAASALIKNNIINLTGTEPAVLIDNSTVGFATLENNTITTTMPIFSLSTVGLVAIGASNTLNGAAIPVDTHYTKNGYTDHGNSATAINLTTNAFQYTFHDLGSVGRSFTSTDGQETIRGGAGNDEISPGGPIEYVLAQGGDDIYWNALVTTGLSSVANMGDGNDISIGRTAQKGVIANMGPGLDICYSSGGLPYNTCSGGDGNDILIGGNNVDKFWNGDAGDDVIFGLGGADRINGGFGDDIMIGGDGTDVLKGNEGTDTSIYYSNYANYSITRLWQGDNSAAVTSADASTAAEVPSQEISWHTEYLQFTDGSYDTVSQTFTPGLIRVDVSIYNSYLTKPTTTVQAQTAVANWVSLNTGGGGGSTPEPNTAPVILTSTLSILAPQQNLGKVITYDSNLADTISYSIVGGPDAPLFTINTTSGVMSLVSASIGGYYSVDVKAQDNGTLPVSMSDTQTIKVTVYPENSTVKKQKEIDTLQHMIDTLTATRTAQGRTGTSWLLNYYENKKAALLAQ